MNEQLIEATYEYYKLKQQYDNQLIDQKKKIIKNDTLSPKDKRKRFKQLKYKCVNCKKEGGSIFTNKNRILSAVCGAKMPCKLNIEIIKGYYINIRDEDMWFMEEINNLKIDIIKIKLMYLFNLISEEESVTEFNIKRNKLSNISVNQHENLILYNDVYNNEKKENEIKKNHLQLVHEIKKIKELYELYKNDNKENKIKEMVDNYISIIKPIEEKIRNLKYEINYIEEIDDTNEVVERAYTISQTEIEGYKMQKV
jgi:hypothetical protein